MFQGQVSIENALLGKRDWRWRLQLLRLRVVSGILEQPAHNHYCRVHGVWVGQDPDGAQGYDLNLESLGPTPPRP
jgi:hypothetical protein